MAFFVRSPIRLLFDPKSVTVRKIQFKDIKIKFLDGKEAKDGKDAKP